MTHVRHPNVEVSFIVQGTNQRLITMMLEAVPRIGETVKLTIKHEEHVGKVVNVDWQIDFTEDEPVGTQFAGMEAKVYLAFD